MDCGNGVCVSGGCECYDGYYGDECQYSNVGTAGYDCVGGSCTYTTVNGTYSTYADCDNACGSGAAGYDCVGGSCTYTTVNGTYATLSDCQNACASACNYEIFTGNVTCNDPSYVPVSATACCSPSYPFHCPETGLCYTTCEAADAACSAAMVVKGVVNGGSAGYVCSSGNCNYVSSGATYQTLEQCQSACSGGGSAGYDCVSGSCNYVSSGADYATQSACQSACGGSGPATGMVFVKIYYQPTAPCTATQINHTLRFYYYCAHGTSLNSVAAGIWTAGQDAGGVYRTATFGNETAALCGHGSTLYNRIYRLEWEVTPATGSYPSECIQSGAFNIDFQNQVKNLIVDWN